MTYKPVFMLSLAAGTLLGAAAFAGSHKGPGMKGNHGHMMEMMQHMHSQMHDGDRHHMHSQMYDGDRHGMHAQMHHGDGHHMMGGVMRRTLDTDGDGTVTPEEAGAQLQAKLKQYDADANGSLSIAEYEALHSAMIREMMVDRFQHLDADGDGQITPEEMNAPAHQLKRRHHLRMKMDSGADTSQGDTGSMGQQPSTQDN